MTELYILKTNGAENSALSPWCMLGCVATARVKPLLGGGKLCTAERVGRSSKDCDQIKSNEHAALYI